MAKVVIDRIDLFAWRNQITILKNTLFREELWSLIPNDYKEEMLALLDVIDDIGAGTYSEGNTY
jgi:hypothetical protein